MLTRITSSLPIGSIATLLLISISSNSSAAQDETLEEVQVYGIRLGSANAQTAEKLPYALQRANAADLERTQSLDLREFMNNTLTSVSINSAQNNPLQPDLQYRGFTASPLLGLPQGLAVYQNGVRINEPLGDSVNWDLLPISTVHSMDLIGGTNPVFGLNSLGGSLVVTTKNGFNYTDTELEAYTGSWDRIVFNAQSGAHFGLVNGDDWDYYVNFSHFEEDGWRDLSKSEADNYYGSLSWRSSTRSALNLIYQHGNSKLTGNGALPVGLLAIDRDAVFTAPDSTKNDMNMLDLEFSHLLTDSVQLAGNTFKRKNTTDAFNGDSSEFEDCQYAGGEQSLFEEADEVEGALNTDLGINLGQICEGEDPDIRNFDELEALIESQANMAGLDPEDFELEDISGDLSGTGVITDDAINNSSRRKQTSVGFNGQITLTEAVYSRPNLLILGFGYFDGKSDFDASLELAELDPVTRSTEGLGIGAPRGGWIGFRYRI